MISYMPFTYVPEPLVDALSELFGTVSVYQPLDTLVPAHMRTAAEKGLLRLYSPDAVDPTLLARTLKSFTAWADLHKDRAGDLAAFFSSEPGQAAGGVETARHIRSQIREMDRNAPAHPSALLQDALFLCLAHSFDQQQDALNRELHAVASLEHRFGQILGEPEAESGPIGPALSHRHAVSVDPGHYMTDRRIVAWARLACSHPMSAPVFITTSKTVWESLCDRLPAAIPLLHGYNEPAKGSTASPARWSALFSDLLQASDPRAVSSDLITQDAAPRSGWAVSLRALIGCPPQRALAILGNVRHDPSALKPAAALPLNTIFGYLQIVSEDIQP